MSLLSRPRRILFIFIFGSSRFFNLDTHVAKGVPDLLSKKFVTGTRHKNILPFSYYKMKLRNMVPVAWRM
jgi:hypothetical protein